MPEERVFCEKQSRFIVKYGKIVNTAKYCQNSQLCYCPVFKTFEIVDVYLVKRSLPTPSSVASILVSLSLNDTECVTVSVESLSFRRRRFVFLLYAIDPSATLLQFLSRPDISPLLQSQFSPGPGCCPGPSYPPIQETDHYPARPKFCKRPPQPK